MRICSWFLAATAVVALSAQPRYTGWADYAGAADSMQYSALKQIDGSNVSHLELAWSYMAPGQAGGGGLLCLCPAEVQMTRCGLMYVKKEQIRGQEGERL